MRKPCFHWYIQPRKQNSRHPCACKLLSRCYFVPPPKSTEFVTRSTCVHFPPTEKDMESRIFPFRFLLVLEYIHFFSRYNRVINHRFMLPPLLSQSNQFSFILCCVNRVLGTGLTEKECLQFIHFPFLLSIN